MGWWYGLGRADRERECVCVRGRMVGVPIAVRRCRSEAWEMRCQVGTIDRLRVLAVSLTPHEWRAPAA
jgi:hypothetical protein